MEGYVYILTNEAMPGLLKIGSTKRSPEQRRRELSQPTGIPIDFHIAYEIFCSEMATLEDYLHGSLGSSRINNRREFFRYDLYKAIELLRNKAEEIRLDSHFKQSGVNEMFDTYEAIEILGGLKLKYPGLIREDLISVRIYQTKLRCYLETTAQKTYGDDDDRCLRDIKIHRMDLGYIAGNDDPENFILFFNPSRPVSENARKFIEDFDGDDILMSGCELFNSYGEEVVTKYNKE